jgi:hypothetical protein
MKSDSQLKQSALIQPDLILFHCRPSLLLGESAKFLSNSPYIKDLATMVIGYGMAINIVEVSTVNDMIYLPTNQPIPCNTNGQLASYWLSAIWNTIMLYNITTYALLCFTFQRKQTYTEIAAAAAAAAALI